MRQLTFKGYLYSQLQYQSGVETTSLYKMCEMSEKNARLKDVVSLCLMLYTQSSLREKLCNKYKYIDSACYMLYGLTDDNIADFLNTEKLSSYKKVYDNYLYMINRKTYEDYLKSVMLEKILEIKSQKGISNYSIYKNLSLNPGNINALLKNNDITKVSIDTAKRILEFVKAK